MITLQQIRAAQWRAENESGMGCANAIVVLDARVLPDRPTWELKARLDYACELWGVQPGRTLMVSGGGIGLQDEVRVMTRYLLNQGIPAPRILTCQPGNTTWKSLCSLSRLQQRYGMHRFIVVSSGYHAARINWIARQLSLEVTVCAPRSTPETRDPTTLRRQHRREFIAWQWIQWVVAVRSGIARVNGLRQAWGLTATDPANATATNPPTQG